MNWKIILASVFLLLGVVLILITAFLVLDKQAAVPLEKTRVLFPSSGIFGSGASLERITLTGQDGAPIEVKDFIQNGETVADTVNPGSYVLAGSIGYCLEDGSCPEGARTDRFSVSYSNDSQSFNVVLLAEPLRDSRDAAERFLLEKLGLSQEDMCRLSYYLGVPYFVNEQFTGEHLKFSFCEGAIVLP